MITVKMLQQYKKKCTKERVKKITQIPPLRNNDRQHVVSIPAIVLGIKTDTRAER